MNEEYLTRNYNTSTDYPKLWELMKKNRIICIVNYGKPDKEDGYQIRDVCETPILAEPSGYIQLSSRGLVYFSAKNREDFIEKCKKYNLEYIIPN